MIKPDQTTAARIAELMAELSALTALQAEGMAHRLDAAQQAAETIAAPISGHTPNVRHAAATLASDIAYARARFVRSLGAAR